VAALGARQPRGQVGVVGEDGPNADEDGVDGGDRRVEPPAVMARLARLGVTSVLIEGGSEIAASCLEAGVVDKLVVFIAPLLIGGREAPPVLGGRGAGLLAEATRLHDVRWTPVGEDLMVEGLLREAPCSPV